MTKQELEKKLASIPIVEPDEVDSQMLAEIESDHDPKDKGRTLDEIISEKEYNGKILLRVPKDLQADLYHEAKEQGVSVNQLCLYKLSQTTPRQTR